MESSSNHPLGAACTLRNIQLPRNQLVKVEEEKEADQKTSTNSHVRDSAEITKDMAELVFSPQYSVLIKSIKMISTKPKGRFSLDRELGILLLLASPGIIGLKIGIGIPVIIGAAATTAVLGPLCLAKKIGKFVANGLDPPLPPSFDKQRQEYVDQFVASLKKIMNDFNEDEQTLFKQDPSGIIDLSMISLAFLSRNEITNQLKMGDEIFTEEDANKLGPNAKEYFKRICSLKSLISDLRLSPDNAQGWKILKESMIELGSEECKLQEFHRVKLSSLIIESMELTQLIMQNPLFQTTWHNSFN